MVGSAGERLEVVSHDLFKGVEGGISGAMAGIEHGMRVLLNQSVCHGGQFLDSFVMVDEVETTHYRLERKCASLKYVFKTVMCATSEQQSFGVERQLVAEVISDAVTRLIFHKQVSVSLGHRMVPGYLGNDMNAVSYLLIMANQQQPVIHSFRPSCCDAMKELFRVVGLSVRIECPADGMG